MKPQLAPNEASPAMVLAAEPPGTLDGRTHSLIQPAGFLGGHEAHEALGEIVLGQERILAAGDDVDNGVADAHDVKSTLSHDALVPRSAPRALWYWRQAPTIFAPQREEHHAMLDAAVQAFREMFTPAFRAVLVKCLGFTIALLLGLIVATEWLFGYFVQWPDWIETTIQWLGGFALVAASIFLIPPVTSLMAGLYLDDIAAEVERTHYPADPPGREMPNAAGSWRRSQVFLRGADRRTWSRCFCC